MRCVPTKRASPGVARPEEAGHSATRASAPRGLAHGAEGAVHRRHGQRRTGRRAAGQELGRRIAQVRVAQVRGVAELLLGGAAGGGQSLALLDPAQAEPILGAGQRTAGEEGGGTREVIARQAAQVRRQQVPLPQFGGGGCHGAGDGGEVRERRGASHGFESSDV